ncbi:cycloeucalenol cycloisomerase isoform X2 [Populus alba]|uniref:cycloeucalenol cycloisomerase isoform X2 n=1 Tax=Populus alba TaxID=43335 RepID=UPI00158A955F|nr:cycloeucalenol cycloisomerase isoform X2 [Populus alba]
MGRDFLSLLYSFLAHSLFGNCDSLQAVRELYRIGILAPGFDLSCSFFLDTNDVCRALLQADSKLCWKDCYWVKASLWIIIFSYVGNYFWTHYFFTVLGASYTFPSWKMNNVPHTTFLLTHVCFLFYHVTSNITIRRLRHAVADLPDSLRWAAEGAWILALSYFIAYLETLAVSNFPYYEFVDRASMYTVGSLFYAIYFFVSFPMFLRIDEKPGDLWELPRVAVDSLGAAMLVTIILDLWRIFLGPIVPLPETKQCLQQGLPWFPGHATQT